MAGATGFEHVFRFFSYLKPFLGHEGRQENINTTSIIKLSNNTYQLILYDYTLLG